ncbi:MAG: hypothetical protein AB7P04_12370 [Bacteriovoracia bacterium]
MKTLRRLKSVDIRSLATTLVIGACIGASVYTPTAQAKPSQDLSRKMRNLEATLQALILDLYDDRRFNDPKNFGRIERNAQKFSRLAHDLKAKPDLTADLDPGVRIIAELFSAETVHAYRALKGGHRAYARDVLKSATNYCMACHTRSQGPSFQGALSAKAFAPLKPYEQAILLASTRQFDGALEEFTRVVKDANASKSDLYAWEKSVRSGLAIAVRVKQDPSAALAIVDQVLKTPTVPLFLKESATQWKKSLNAWQSEPNSQATTEEGYYQKAIRFLSEARALQRYPLDRSADILYLRASAAIHDMLRTAPNGKHVTEGLYLAGLAYEVLSDLSLPDLHEFYFLACIQSAPHSEFARRCFERYEQDVIYGYTGSAGTDIPDDIQGKLRRLDALSLPLTAPKELQ